MKNRGFIVFFSVYLFLLGCKKEDQNATIPAANPYTMIILKEVKEGKGVAIFPGENHLHISGEAKAMGKNYSNDSIDWFPEKGVYQQYYKLVDSTHPDNYIFIGVNWSNTSWLPSGDFAFSRYHFNPDIHLGYVDVGISINNEYYTISTRSAMNNGTVTVEGHGGISLNGIFFPADFLVNIRNLKESKSGKLLNLHAAIKFRWS